MVKKVDALVTGGAGFIGLAVAEQLLHRGRRIAILDKLAPPEEFVDYARTLPGSLEVQLCDITDKEAIANSLAAHDPDLVIHGAAVTPDADRERRTPELVIQTNIVGTQNLLEALRSSSNRRLVHLSTSGVYGDIANRPGFTDARIGETVLADPSTLYALSKAAAEKLVLRYGVLFGVDFVCARVGLCWGPWEYDTGIRDPFSVPLQLLRVAQEGGTAILPRDPVKDWAYSRDVGRAIVALSEARGLPSPIYNIGSDDVWPASEWAERLRLAYPEFTYGIGSKPGAQYREPVEIEVYGSKDRAPLDVVRLKTDARFSFQYRSTSAFEDYLNWASQFRCWRDR